VPVFVFWLSVGVGVGVGEGGGLDGGGGEGGGLDGGGGEDGGLDGGGGSVERGDVVGVAECDGEGLAVGDPLGVGQVCEAVAS